MRNSRRRARPHAPDLCRGLRTGGRLDGAKLAALVAAIEAKDAGLAVNAPVTEGR
jgi:hypothetical protein